MYLFSLRRSKAGICHCERSFWGLEAEGGAVLMVMVKRFGWRYEYSTFEASRSVQAE